MNEIKCPTCGQLNPPDYVFCIGCGTKITSDVSFDTGFSPDGTAAVDTSAEKRFGDLKCPNCGSDLEPDSIFCDNCGIRLVTPAVPSVPDTAIDAAAPDAGSDPHTGLKISMKNSGNGGAPNQSDRFKPVKGFDK
ncbi:MAG: zinc ribbon domain-containing protein [Ruminococcus sp.]|nr:zinc ribbon domain-containing protein [Ruminococcus sp.]